MIVTLGQPLSPDRDIFDALIDAIDASGRWSNGGAVVQQFEAHMEADLGWASVAATTSGTMALTLALIALDLPANAEVVTTPLTFPASVQAIEAAGLSPVFAAVDANTLNLDPVAVRDAIGPRTGAILPVHLFGVAADPALDDIASRAGLPIIHDAAHAFGFEPIVGRGTATAYSLHATKLLHTGEGGLVATNDVTMAHRIRQARSFGLDGERVASFGTNGKMAEPTAALGIAVRARLAAEIEARQALRNAYTNALGGPSRYRVHAPGQPRALVLEAIRCEPQDQQDLLDQLAAVDVIARRFPALCEPDHRYACVPLVGCERADVIELARSVIALPLHGRVTPAHVESIVATLSC